MKRERTPIRPEGGRCGQRADRDGLRSGMERTLCEVVAVHKSSKNTSESHVDNRVEDGDGCGRTVRREAEVDVGENDADGSDSERV